MYILSCDFGSSNNKAIVLKIEENNSNGTIDLIGKKKSIANVNQEKFIDEVIDIYNIELQDIEIIIATGTGSTYLEDEYKGVKIFKVREFDAIGYGGIVLSKLDEAIITSIGTGTAFVYSNLDKIEHLGGTGLGGGTLLGLGRKVLGNSALNFQQIIDIAKKGSTSNVDLQIKDINKTNIDNLTMDITAANFAGICKKFNDNDFVAGIVNMIIENVSLLGQAYNTIFSNSGKRLPIVFIGTMVEDKYIQDCIKKFALFTKEEVYFVTESAYAISIGAYEYYMLKYRIPIKP